MLKIFSDHFSRPHYGLMVDSFLGSQRLALPSAMPQALRPIYLCERRHSHSMNNLRRCFGFYFGSTISISFPWLTLMTGFRQSLSFDYVLIYEIKLEAVVVK